MLSLGVKDIHDSTFQLPDTVFILASGLNGIPAYPLIPKDAYIIGMNRSIQIPYDYPDIPQCKIWMIGDHTATKKKYFKPLYEKFKGIKAFSNETADKIKRYGFGKTNPGKCFTYNLFPKNHRERGFTLRTRIFNINGTVAGNAIWLCFLKNVKLIYLIGVDLKDDKDFTGELPQYGGKHGKVWKSARRLDEQIVYQTLKKQRIISLSPTTLESVSVINHIL